MGQISQSSFLRFLLVGGSATVLHYSIMGGMMHVAGATPGIASATGYILSTLYNYWANSLFTFGGFHDHGRRLQRFLVTALTGLGINQGILLTAVHLSFSIPFAQLTSTIAVLFWNYFINATWTFAKRDYR
jgi:putative flippase GtrA